MRKISTHWQTRPSNLNELRSEALVAHAAEDGREVVLRDDSSGWRVMMRPNRYDGRGGRRNEVALRVSRRAPTVSHNAISWALNACRRPSFDGTSSQYYPESSENRDAPTY